MPVRPLIEQWFPADIVGVESLRERGASSALPPINFLHVWWARRPLVSCRAAVLGSLLPAWPDLDEADDDAEVGRTLKGLESEFPGGEAEYRDWFVSALGVTGDPIEGRRRIAAARDSGERLVDGGYGYPRAFTVRPSDADLARLSRLSTLRAGVSEPPTVLDPFAGGGSIPFEAARVGCEAFANELNPVASAILTATAVLPPLLGPEFASTIQHWGSLWAGRIQKRLEPYFPLDPGEASIVAYIWANSVPCPTTGLATPLAPDFWLSKGAAGNDVAVKLTADIDSGSIEREIVEGAGAADWGQRSTYKRGVARSIWTDETFGADYIREQSKSGRMNQMLLAVSLVGQGRAGRGFRVPTEADLQAIRSVEAEVSAHMSQWELDDLVPSEEIPAGQETAVPRRIGLNLWRDLFSPRQILTLSVAIEELRGIVREAREDLGDQRANALSLYLSFSISKALNYNSRLCVWHATRTRVGNVFSRHDLSFVWSFAEMDGARSLWPWAVEQVAKPYREIAELVTRESSLLEAERRSSVSVGLGSATDLPVETGTMDLVVTDPPYYDNVMYAELSDYFYVWLKRSLRDTWPQFCVLPLSDKEGEAVANPSLFVDVATVRSKRKAGDKSAADLADEHYERLLTQSFREAHRVLKSDGVMTVMFTHKRVDAWDTLGQALLESGFSINSSWPVHTESEHSLHQAKKNAASSTIFLTCRKRGDTQPAYWTDIRGDVAGAARSAAARFSKDGMHGIDLTLSTFGPVLSVLSRNWPVYTGELDADGNPQVLRPDVALNLAREEVARLKKRGLLGGRDVDFDRITDWYLLAWLDFAAAEFPSGEALKLSLATHLELDDLSKQHKVVRATSGTVTLLTPAQRRTAGSLDPQAASWPTMIDALHTLMLTYDEDGLAAAKAWLDRTGKADDAKFHDLVAAAILAIPRAREKGELIRPEARTLEGLRATLFDDIAAPVDEEDVSAGPAQAALFEST